MESEGERECENGGVGSKRERVGIECEGSECDSRREIVRAGESECEGGMCMMTDDNEVQR